MPDPEGGVVRLPVAVRTRIWGTLPGVVQLPFSGDGDDARVDWRPNLVFPGLDPGRHLTRNTALGQRGDILARNGQPLVSGAGRAVAFPEAQSLAGEMGSGEQYAERVAGMAVPIHPTYFTEVWGNPIIMPTSVVGLSLLAIGNFIMYRMVNFKV